jgi:anti-sigma factor RsiW
MAADALMPQSSSLTPEDQADLVAYLDGELTGPAAASLEAKLNRDPRARSEAQLLRRTWEMLDYLPRPEASVTFTTRTLERLAVRRIGSRTPLPDSWRKWAAGAGWAAAVAAALGVGYLAGQRLPHQPPAAAEATPDLDRELARNLRVIENRSLYDHVDDITFLRALAASDLFGEDRPEP